MGLFDSILGTVGGVLGAGAAKGDVGRSDALINQNLEEIQNLALPDYEKMIRQYALLQAGKEYTPEQLVAEQMQRNYMSGVKTDPEMLAKQRQYMDYLQGISKTGMTADEMAQRNALMRSMEAAQQGKIADIERQAAQTGMSSSGSSLLAKMTGQQQAQNMASEQAERLAGQMEQRRMGAQGTLAQQAAQMDQTQYARALQQAQNQQALDQFNLQQRAGAKQYNVEAMNAAQRANLARQQQVSDTNVGLLNKQQEYNKELERQRYLDQMAKYGYTSGARSQAANAAMNRAKRTAGEIAGIGQAIGSGIDYSMGIPSTEEKKQS